MLLHLLEGVTLLVFAFHLDQFDSAKTSNAKGGDLPQVTQFHAREGFVQSGHKSSKVNLKVGEID